MPTRDDRVFAAGLIDGEGCIYISKVKTKGVKYHSLNVSVTTADDVLTPWLKTTFGGNSGRYADKRKNHSETRTWNVASQAAENFLRSILPWLKLKKPQAELALHFRTLKRDAYKISPKVLAAREQCYERLKEMHGRVPRDR